MHSPKKVHLQVARWVLEYLKGTVHLEKILSLKEMEVT